MLKRYISGCGVGIYEDTNLTRCVSIINDTSGVLFVNVKIDVFSTNDDCYQVGLTQTFFDSWTIAEVQI